MYNNKNEDYVRGSKDAWELAKRIERIQFIEREKVFGLHGFWEILQKYTPQEALTKIEAYEKGKEIKVGDEVIHGEGISETKFIVTSIGEVMIRGFDGDGFPVTFPFPNRFIEKTGRHVEIEGFLRQIRELERDDDYGK